MASYKENLQRIANEYIASTGNETFTTREIAEWAINSGLWKPQPGKLISQCSEDIAKALREEFFTDPLGRRVRVKHVVTRRRNGQQTCLWTDIKTASREHMEISFKQRRRQIVEDCVRLDIDKDSFNENYNIGEPIQITFDFTNDIAEDRIMRPSPQMSTEELQRSNRPRAARRKSPLQSVLSRI